MAKSMLIAGMSATGVMMKDGRNLIGYQSQSRAIQYKRTICLALCFAHLREEISDSAGSLLSSIRGSSLFCIWSRKWHLVRTAAMRVSIQYYRHDNQSYQNPRENRGSRKRPNAELWRIYLTGPVQRLMGGNGSERRYLRVGHALARSARWTRQSESTALNKKWH
jgi:hypothetical protein